MATTDDKQEAVLVHARWGREHDALYDAWRMLCDTNKGQLVLVRFMVSHMTSKVDRFTASARMRRLQSEPWVTRVLSETVRRADKPADPFAQARASLEQTGGTCRTYELILQC